MDKRVRELFLTDGKTQGWLSAEKFDKALPPTGIDGDTITFEVKKGYAYHGMSFYYDREGKERPDAKKFTDKEIQQDAITVVHAIAKRIASLPLKKAKELFYPADAMRPDANVFDIREKPIESVMTYLREGDTPEAKLYQKHTAILKKPGKETAEHPQAQCFEMTVEKAVQQVVYRLFYPMNTTLQRAKKTWMSEETQQQLNDSIRRRSQDCIENAGIEISPITARLEGIIGAHLSDLVQESAKTKTGFPGATEAARSSFERMDNRIHELKLDSTQAKALSTAIVATRKTLIGDMQKAQAEAQSITAGMNI